MGLSVEVGYLADLLENDEEGARWFREDLSRLNLLLAASELAPHDEPEACPVFSYELFGYSGLHYLRRIAAHLDLRDTMPPPGDEHAANDPVLREYYDLTEQPGFLKRQPPQHLYDHLLFHDDSAGYYLPQDFPVLLPPGSLELPGWTVGSSVRLAEECRGLARRLDLPLGLDPDADEVSEAAESQGQGTGWRRYGVEALVCLRLYHAARKSLELRAAMVFC